MRIAVTGAGGFVGRRVVQALAERGHEPMPIRRHATADGGFSYESAPLAGAAAVIHAGARVHVLRDREPDPLAAFRRANRDATLALAERAAAAGVDRFVFVSTIHVNGTSTTGRQPYRTDDPPAPVGPYARSKLEAEEGLWQRADRTGMELSVVRPVLVCGPGAGGNLARLAAVCRRGLPLPLASVANRRSLIHVDDLADLLVLAAEGAGAGRTLLAADPEALSTPALIRAICRAQERPARLFSCPVALLRLGGRLTGMSATVEQLAGSLEADPTETMAATGWRPRRGVGAAIEDFVRGG